MCHSTVDAHMREHHPVCDLKPFTCKLCKRRFSQKGHLKQHSLVHTGERRFECDDCGKGFSRKGHLNVHSLVHTKERRFKCDDCGKSFSRKGHLKRHSQQVHPGERP